MSNHDYACRRWAEWTTDGITGDKTIKVISRILRRGLGLDEPTLNMRLTNTTRLLDLAEGIQRRLRRLGGP